MGVTKEKKSASKSFSDENTRNSKKSKIVKVRETKSTVSSVIKPRKSKQECRGSRCAGKPNSRTASSNTTNIEIKQEPTPLLTGGENTKAVVPGINETEINGIQQPQYIFYIPRVPQPVFSLAVPQNGSSAQAAVESSQHQGEENVFYNAASNQAQATQHGSLQSAALAIPPRRYHNNVQEKLQYIVAEYIDHLLDENEDVTEISKSYAPPMDPNFEAEEYYQRTQRKRITFPTRKFNHWLQSSTQYNVQEVTDLIGVVRGEIPETQFKGEYRAYANEVHKKTSSAAEEIEREHYESQ